MKTLKYSRQRETIKNCLMNRHDHPTADAIYMAIREENPNISLGTVYRNLNLLVELGEIRKLNFGCGPDRFDASLEPHYHFICKDCGSVTDICMEPFVQLNESAQHYCSGCIDSHRINFYGICKECSAKKEE